MTWIIWPTGCLVFPQLYLELVHTLFINFLSLEGANFARVDFVFPSGPVCCHYYCVTGEHRTLNQMRCTNVWTKCGVSTMKQRWCIHIYINIGARGAWFLGPSCVLNTTPPPPPLHGFWVLRIGSQFLWTCSPHEDHKSYVKPVSGPSDLSTGGWRSRNIQNGNMFFSGYLRWLLIL